MSTQRTAPCGIWKSPISSELIASEKIWLRNVALDNNNIYWLEARAADGGRFVIVQCTPDGSTRDLTPFENNVRNQIYEYGGGYFTVNHGTIYFSNHPDGRVYRQVPPGLPVALTPAGSWRFGDFEVDELRQRLICVGEDSSRPGQPVHSLVSIGIGPAESMNMIASGNDFYAFPRLSPDQSKLAWIEWSHPNMPWDGTELWVGEFSANGTLESRQCLAGGAAEAIFQPEWSPDGSLYFISDRSGWWNLYRWQAGVVRPVIQMEAEFAAPLWHLGTCTYAVETDQRLFCTYNQQGTWHLASINTATNEMETMVTPFTEIFLLRAVPGKLVFVASSPSMCESIIQYDPSARTFRVLRQSMKTEISPNYISLPQALEFPTSTGLTSHAFYYPPVNQDFCSPGEKPPLIVTCHGGPTEAARTQLDYDIQFWTSRGFAFVDVNYGGSSGYGRSYRNRLYGNWGIIDVQDCHQAAQYLIEQQLVDPDRVVIRGHSAGGFTALRSLIDSDLYKAGAIYFGISDLEGIVRTTHKFESHYNIRLVAPYPERRDIYQDRSPLYHSEGINVPVIFFQGLKDRVVPPEQTQEIVDAMKKRGIPVTLLTFEDEHHGFLKAKNLERCYQEELAFYLQVLSIRSR